MRGKKGMGLHDVVPRAEERFPAGQMFSLRDNIHNLALKGVSTIAETSSSRCPATWNSKTL
ncbi:hypothetical protein [Mesorhizobium delmotii]|uniref:hypothetical protein n=1 Tax=Mesorhizobium delmotii TaxID=1631247 RepID=UPI001057FF5D|nr:hypothetical protein [Mesorhizobium delmotii]